MNKTSVPITIHEAELRVIQSSQNVSDGLRRVQLAFRSSVKRPSTLLKVAGVTGLVFFCLARRTRSHAAYPVKNLWQTTLTSLLGLVLGYMTRYVMGRLATVLR